MNLTEIKGGDSSRKAQSLMDVGMDPKGGVPRIKYSAWKHHGSVLLDPAHGHSGARGLDGLVSSRSG